MEFSSVSGSRRFKGRISGSTNLESSQTDDARSSELTTANVSSKNRLFEEKFKFIKDSNKPDPALRSFNRMLNILMVLFWVIYVIGILIVNLYPSPKPFYMFMQSLAMLNVKANELIFAARYLQLQQDESINTGPCSFNPENTTYRICPWVTAAEGYIEKTVPDLKYFLYDVQKKLIQQLNDFQSIYMKIRVPGDDLDVKVIGNFRIGQFVNRSADNVTEFDTTTLWNVYSLFLASGEMLDAEFNVTKAQRDWNFIMNNRYVFNNFNTDLLNMIPAIAGRNLENLALAHLVLAIVSIAAAVVCLNY